MSFKYGFIGCGNMGSCLISAVSKTVEPKDVAVCDFSLDKAENMKKQYGVIVSDICEIAEKAKYIVLGVKPQGMADTLLSIADILKKRLECGNDFIIVTMLAGVTTDKIEKTLNLKCKVIRIMPNTPCQVGEGMVLYCANLLVEDADKADFLNDMQKAGLFDEIEEGKIDMACAVSGCGPAFAYMFIDAIADGAVKCGLSRDKALIYASKMLEGSAKMVMQTGIHPAKLKDNVCSPGGSTIEGVQTLEKYAFRSAVSESVISAYKRTVELGK